MAYKVLIPDNVAQSAIDILTNAEGFEVNAPGKLSKEDIMPIIAAYDAMIVRSGVKPDAEMIAAATNLKAIARAGVGTDNIDKAAATKHGVIVVNTPGGNTIATVEHAFGLLLALLRQIPQGHQSLVEGRWDRKAFMGNELKGKTIGFVGFGRIGQAFAKRARAFEMSTVAFDPYLDPQHPGLAETQTPLVSLDEVFEEADIISLHPLLTDETRGMINKEAIAKMRPGVIIVNAARGALIDDQALADAIKAGHVRGAALDVFEPEPPSDDNPLIGLEGVIHTPHLAASTVEAQITVAEEAAELIITGLTTGQWNNVVNTDVLVKI